MGIYNNKQFKKLKKEWDKKLKESGFRDYEKSDTNFYSKRKYLKSSQSPDILEFYLALSYFVSHTKVKDLDRDILKLWSEGVAKQDIAKQLDIHYMTVNRHIKKYTPIIWKLKYELYPEVED